jgi:putative ABC transport system permease protein
MSHRCWANRFGADPNIIGKQFRLNDEPYRAIGVLPPGPSDRQDEEIWVPLRFSPAELARGATFWYVSGRLKSGVSIRQAQDEMSAVTWRIGELYPATNKNWGAKVEPLKNYDLNPSTRANLWLLLGAVSFVLLIACVNVANLLLARGAARQRELSVRAALGASRAQLVSQLLAESLTLAGLGGALGILLSAALLKMILLIVPPFTFPPETDVRLSLPVLLFTLGTTILSGVLFGCAPALQVKNVDVNEGLKEGGRSAVGAGHVRLRQSLVSMEFALALSLLAGAALTVHSFVNRTHADLGVRTDHILTFYLPVPQPRLAKPEQTENFYRDLLARIEGIPGIQRAAAGTDTPLDETNLEMTFHVAGRPFPDRSSLPDAPFQAVTPGYFETFGVQIDRGRIFNQRDGAHSPRVAMVNEAFARRFLGGTDPLSQRLAMEQLRNGVLALGPEVEWQIVGVFHDVQNGGRVGEAKRPQIYVPFAQSPWPGAIVAVRTATDPEKAMKAIAAAVHSLDPNLPLAHVKTMQQLVHDHFEDDRFGMALYGSLAGIALILASLGIYGVMSFTVAQSTAEIGLRMALGASTRDVLLRVLKQGLAMAGTGLALGFAGAYLVGRAMQSSLYGTGAVDWSAFSTVAALLLLAALRACYVPARRASSVDPMIALRRG